MSTERPNYVAFALNMAPGLIGALLGGAASWGVAQQKLDDFERRIGVVEVRQTVTEAQVNDMKAYMAGQFGEIKAKLDHLSAK